MKSKSEMSTKYNFGRGHVYSSTRHGGRTLSTHVDTMKLRYYDLSLLQIVGTMTCQYFELSVL